MTDSWKQLARQHFRRSVRIEADSADERFPQMQLETDDVWVMVLVEEVGKLARCANKLHLAVDREVVAHWQNELDARLVTVASISERFAARRRFGNAT